MSRDDRSHLPLQTVHDRSLRTDERGGTVVGYNAGPEGPRAIPGDEKFPFVMVPPDLFPTQRYVFSDAPFADPLAPVLPAQTAPFNTATRFAEMATGAAIDVRGVRALTFYVSLQILGAGRADTSNVLNLVPQVANKAISPVSLDDSSGGYTSTATARPALLWHSIGVVDPYIRGAFPTALDPEQALLAPTYGFRNVHMSQLSLPFASTGNVNIHTTIVFDVAPYEYFRLRYGLSTVEYPPDTTYVFPNAADASLFGDLFRLDYQAER